mgnify:FL=1
MKTDKNNYLMIGPYKEAALKQVISKEKEFRTYPINKSDLLTIKKCPLCYSKNTEPVAELYINFKLKILSTDICNNCFFVFRSVSPNLNWFKKCWRLIQTKKLEVFNQKVVELRERRYKKYYKILSKYVKNGKMLDIGAAYGTGTDVFRKHGFSVEAVEPEINKVNYLRKALKIPVVCDAIENLIMKKRNYDLIIFSACFEHVDHPNFIMSNMKNLLRNKHGILYLDIPIIWNYISWSDALYLPHKSNFTEDNIIDLMTKNGFRILEMFYLWDHSLWNQPQNGKNPSDTMGMVLQYDGEAALVSNNKPAKYNKFNSEYIRSLYRKDLPIKLKLPINATIRYSVPYVNQFFQTLRIENKKIVKSKSRPEFLVFEDVKSN